MLFRNNYLLHKDPKKQKLNLTFKKSLALMNNLVLAVRKRLSLKQFRIPNKKFRIIKIYPQINKNL